MKGIILLAFSLAASSATAFSGERQIAFERNNAVYLANLDGTGERKIADGIFPAISPDGTRVAFNTVEKTSETTYIRHIAVTDVATGTTTVFKDVPSDNSYYPTWSPDGNRILFTLRQNEVWDLGVINADGTGFRLLKKGAAGEVTRYSPIWARDGQSVFCQDMTNIYRLGLDGAVIDQLKIDKIIPNGDMSGDCRIDVSPDGKRLLLGIELGEEANRKDWDGPCLPYGRSISIHSGRSDSLPKNSWAGTAFGSTTTTFSSSAGLLAKRTTRFMECRSTEKIQSA